MKRKIDFQDGGHLGFLIRRILTIFDLQVIPMLPTKFQVSWPFGSGDATNRFQDGNHGSSLGFLTGTILTIFDLQVSLMLPTKFQVSWPFGSGEEVKNRLSRWRQQSNRNNFSYFFLFTSLPHASYQVSSQLTLRFRRRSKKQIFKMAAMAVILDFQSKRFFLFLIYKLSQCFFPSFESIVLGV